MSEQEFVEFVREIREDVLMLPKYDKYESEQVYPEISPIMAEMQAKGISGVTEYGVQSALTTIHIVNERQATWKKRVLKGATLLDEIAPGWEDRIDFARLEVKLVYLTEWKSVLTEIYQEDDLRKVLPLVFAGQGLENVRGMRRQPGPPPKLDESNSSNPWEGEITTGHYAAAKAHGFTSGTSGCCDFLPEDKLALLWMDFIMIRKLSSL